ncbi:MAG: hypothetical protein E7231_00565 [Cellulosilyticum sp.]|nr:hypothetical protein [Cellulosilyticum sp.]
MSRIKELFKTLFKRKNVETLVPSSVQEIFSELEEVEIKKQRIAHYIEELNIKEEAHRQYENLDPEAVTQINALAQKAKDIEEKKQNLKGRLISTNAALLRLSQYEEEIPDLIKEMQDAEKRLRETESHIFYLQEERSELEEEREALIGGYKILKGMSYAFCVFLGVCLLVSYVLLQILREKIWFVLSGIVGLMLFFIVMIVLIKEKLEKEIKDNGILQQKAVKYLNKSKIRFFHQTQYLEFQYHKLGVDSVAKLELYYNRYLKNKNNERVYLQMNDMLNEIEEDILKILHQKDILLEDIGDLADWILQPKMLNEMKRLEEDREKTQEQLEALNLYEEELWKELSVMALDDAFKIEINEWLQTYRGENRLDKILAS